MRNTIILTVHNKVDSINTILYSIENTVSIWTRDLIIVLDGCNDGTCEVVNDFVRDSILNVKVCTTPDVWETIANNVGMKQVSTELLTIIQDDMFIEEVHWDQKMALNFIDKAVAGVTARTGLDVFFDDNQILIGKNFIGREDPYGASTVFGRLVAKYRALTQSFKPINKSLWPVQRSIINRGPLMLRVEAVEKLNYFDEKFAPFEFDDADFCLRAAIEFNYKFLVYPVAYNEIGGSKRNSSISSSMSKKCIVKNSKILYDRYEKK